MALLVFERQTDGPAGVRPPDWWPCWCSNMSMMALLMFEHQNDGSRDALGEAMPHAGTGWPEVRANVKSNIPNTFVNVNSCSKLMNFADYGP